MTALRGKRRFWPREQSIKNRRDVGRFAIIKEAACSEKRLMPRAIPLCSLLIAVAVVSGTAQQQPFRASADTVPVYATVTDKSGRLVPDLTRAAENCPTSRGACRGGMLKG
jgi:hypothetical protein